MDQYLDMNQNYVSHQVWDNLWGENWTQVTIKFNPQVLFSAAADWALDQSQPENTVT